MVPIKTPMNSMTIWGGLLLFITWLKNKLSWDLTATQIETIVEVLVGIASFAMIVWGRMRAQGPLSLRKPPFSVLAIVLLLPSLGGCKSLMAEFESEDARVAQSLADEVRVFSAAVRGLTTANKLGLVSDKDFLAARPIIKAVDETFERARLFYEAGETEAARKEVDYVKILQSQLEVLVQEAIKRRSMSWYQPPSYSSPNSSSKVHLLWSTRSAA